MQAYSESKSTPGDTAISGMGGAPPAGERGEITRLLCDWGSGNRAALDEITPKVMADLRVLANSVAGYRAADSTLGTTALINEAYLRLAAGRAGVWKSRRQFFAYMASTMRRIVINHARDRQTTKRGGSEPSEALDEGQVRFGGRSQSETTAAARLLDLHRAIEALAELDPRQAHLVELRYFGGLTVQETADLLGVSARTVKREWSTARLWLRKRLTSGDPGARK